ncbi:MAG: hypothetical protein IBX72_11385 [Nitrospirae bacterium]|nr:hypothetical protein [Nitrospirota bacterium]
MIELLSKKQEELLWKTMEIWFNNAYAKKDFNRDLIEDSIGWLYSIAGLKKPEISYAKSPLQCQSIASIRKITEHKNQITSSDLARHIRCTIEKQFNETTLLSDLVYKEVRERVWDQLSLVVEGKCLIERYLKRNLKGKLIKFSRDGIAAFQWCSYYEFFQEIGVITSNSSFDKYRNFIFNSGIFLSIYDKDNVIVCPNPLRVYFNKELQLHYVDGAAISWEDGYKLYCLSGHALNEEIVMNYAEKLRQHRNIKNSFKVYEKDGILYVKR